MGYRFSADESNHKRGNEADANRLLGGGLTEEQQAVADKLLSQSKFALSLEEPKQPDAELDQGRVIVNHLNRTKLGR